VLSTLFSFSNDTTNGGYPQTALVLGSDDNLYGTTGASVFRMTTNGVLTTLAWFTTASNLSGLISDSDGNLYGTSVFGPMLGGNNGCGTVFKVTTNGMATVLAAFNYTNGYQPSAGLVLGNDGKFYGTTVYGGSSGNGTVFQVTPSGALTSLVSFADIYGANPRAGLVLGDDGNFYGTTSLGGTNGNGTAFRVMPTGALTTLVHFNGFNGANPQADLVLGNDGSFYGMTEGGGTAGYGTMFKLTPNGTLTTLVNFALTNGANPQAGLALASDGSFYGTTSQGGSGSARGRYGTVFQVTTNGTLTTLVNLKGTNGASPQSELVLGSDNSFYGTTYNGGSSGNGTVFKVTANGTLTTLFSFGPTTNTGGAYINANGANPFAGLTKASDGNFYGTTSLGGTDGNGTMFQVTPNGALTTLVNFNGFNGADPQAALALGPDGSFYGTTLYGTIFKVTTDGAFTTLAGFNYYNGESPSGKLTLGSDGSFYGTTQIGGSDGLGVIFRLDLPPGIISQPASRTNGVGTTAPFTVTTTGTQPFSYQWLKNGTNLLEGGNISGAGTSTLTLANIQTNDSGVFAVVVTNISGSVTSSVAVLTVRASGWSSVASLQAGVPGSHTNTLAFAGFPNSLYLVQFATNLTSSSWFTLSTNTAAADGIWTVIDPTATNAQRFYRVASP